MRILASGRKKLRFSTIAFDGTSRLAAGGGCNPTFVWDIASGDVLARLDQTIAFDNQSLHFRNGALLVPTDDGLFACDPATGAGEVVFAKGCFVTCVALDAAGDWCVMDHTGAGKKVEPTLASVVRPGSARQKSGWSVPLAERGLGLITAEYLASLPGKKHFLVAEHFVSGREGTNRRITIRERADASVWMAAYGLFERGDIVCASPFGHIMVVLSKATLRAYDSRGLSESIRPIRNDEKKHFTAVAFHPSGRFLLVASTDETVKLYDVRTWEVVRSFAWDIGRMRSVAFSPDGTLAAAGSDKGKVVVWDVDI